MNRGQSGCAQNTREFERSGEFSFGVALLCTRGSEVLVPATLRAHNLGMRAMAVLLVVVAFLFGIYQFYLKKMPTTDPGTAPTQAISLTGVRADLLQIAQAERGSIALNGHCSSLDDLISSGSLTMGHPERDGYSYQIA